MSNEYVVLLDNASSVNIFADSCEWDSDSIEFINEDEAGFQTTIAMFKMEHIIGYFKVKEGNKNEQQLLEGVH